MVMKYTLKNYKSIDVFTRQKHIKFIKDKFERKLSKSLNLIRVSAPILVTKESGLQDDLTGVERKVCFDIKKDGKELEIVQSLAKWKRFALDKYNIPVGKGIYTDMLAIRRDDEMDELHSIYVDQWDWEKHIRVDDKNYKYLKNVVEKIVNCIYETNELLKLPSDKKVEISKNVYFISSQDLFDMYPNKTAKEREYLIVKKYKTVFISQIGKDLSDGKPHDKRAPDYDDWALNGDLLFYHKTLDCALEISSMGIRVDKNTLINQLNLANATDRMEYQYHKSILSDKLPCSIGGGIGQSRLCMLLLGCAHIGEVQASYWDKENLEKCKINNIDLL